MNSKKLNISKSRLIIGLLVGLFFAISFYGILYIGREVLRYATVTDDYVLLILTDSEVAFYNLIFGFIAAIIGQSVFFTYVFNRPRKFFETKHYWRKSIVRDQWFLIISFLSYLIGLSSVLVFPLYTGGGFYAFSLYPQYNFIFILVVFVLFLQNWTTIGRVFKNKSSRWRLVAVLIVSLLAFGLSKINLIDYKTINELCLRKNVIQPYKIKLPNSEHIDKRWGQRLYMVTENSKQICIIDDKKIEIDSLKYVLGKPTADGYYNFDVYNLYISKEQKMSVVNKLKMELSKLGVVGVSYAVVPFSPEYDERYYHDRAINMRLPDFREEEQIREYYNQIYAFENRIELKTLSEEKFIFNNSVLSKEELEIQLKNTMVENPDYVIKYIIDDNNSFAEYIATISLFIKTIDDFRDEYSFKNYGDKFDSLYGEKRETVLEKYPLRRVEITEELTNLLNEK